MPWRGFALSWERSSLSLCLSSFMFTVAPVAFMQRVSNYPSSKIEVSLQKIRYLGKAIGTEYNSPYKDSEPFWNFFPPRRKAFFVCFICYGCPFIRRRTNSGLVSADSVPWSEGEPPASYGSSRLIIGGSGVGNFRRCWRLRQRLLNNHKKRLNSFP